jgi:hypothetical protein
MTSSDRYCVITECLRLICIWIKLCVISLHGKSNTNVNGTIAWQHFKLAHNEVRIFKCDRVLKSLYTPVVRSLVARKEKCGRRRFRPTDATAHVTCSFAFCFCYVTMYDFWVCFRVNVREHFLKSVSWLVSFNFFQVCMESVSNGNLESFQLRRHLYSYGNPHEVSMNLVAYSRTRWLWHVSFEGQVETVQ